MFSLSAPEVVLVLLYFAGVVSALYVFISARGARSSVLLLCAVSLPILGSVAAIALAAARLRSRDATRAPDSASPRLCPDEGDRAMMS